MHYLRYLTEFRSRFLNTIGIYIFCFILFFYFSDTIIDYFSIIILKEAKTVQLVAHTLPQSILMHFKISHILSLLITIPFIILQLWAFIKPALMQNEKYSIGLYIILSFILYTIGIFFGFFILCPMSIQFLLLSLPENMSMMADISHYIDFISQITISSGMVFQVPIVIQVGLQLNWWDREQLRLHRKYVIVLFFVLGMLLTPPDVVSQVMIAIPMCILFEIGTLDISSFRKRELQESSK